MQLMDPNLIRMQNKNSPIFTLTYLAIWIFCLLAVLNRPFLHAENLPSITSQQEGSPADILRLTPDKGPFISGSKWVVRLWISPSKKSRQICIQGPSKGFELSYPSNIAPSDIPQLVLLKMKASEGLAAQTYTFHVALKEEEETLVEQILPIEIMALSKVSMNLENAPDFLTDRQPTILQLRLKNEGNTKQELAPHTQAPGVSFEKGLTYLTLEPGQSQTVNVYLLPASQGANTYNLSLGWKDRLTGELFFNTFRFRFYRSSIVEEKTYSIASKAKVFFSSQDHKTDSGYQISGSGAYNPQGTRKLRYEINVPTRYQLEEPSNAATGYVTWEIPKFKAQVGDQSYNLGSFVENTNKGRGIGAQGKVGPVQIGGYFQRKWDYQRNVADPSKARQQAFQTSYSNNWSKTSISYLARKDLQASAEPIRQIAIDSTVYQTRFWQCSLDWAYQISGKPNLLTSTQGLDNHPQALKSQLDFLKLPKVLLGINYNQTDNGFNSGYSDTRLVGFTLSGKNSSKVNWNILANQSRSNLKRLEGQDSSLTRNIYQSASGFISPAWQWQSSINYTHRQDVVTTRANDGVALLGQMGATWRFHRFASLTFSEQVNYYSFKMSQNHFFPVTGQRYTFNWYPTPWLSQSFFFENSKIVNDLGKKVNRSLGYSIYANFDTSTLSLSYQASLPNEMRSKILSARLSMILNPLWTLSFSLDSRSSYDFSNDYRWNLSLERKFDLVVARKKAPGSVKGKLIAIAPAKLPDNPIVSVSGVQVKAKGDTYEIAGIPLGSHPVYLTNMQTNTLEKTLPPTQVELTQAQPIKIHNIEVVAASVLAGTVESLKILPQEPVLKSQESHLATDKHQNTPSTSTPHQDWEKRPLEGVTVVATDMQSGQVVKCKSDPKGRFRFSCLRPGQWKISLELDQNWLKEERLDLKPFPDICVLEPGQRQNISIELCERPKKWKML